jgi:2-dehydro-3-deoxyphosphogluconate aldolase/(4S)-4-hydroxy-2-oxoglutarate aldolase
LHLDLFERPVQNTFFSNLLMGKAIERLTQHGPRRGRAAVPLLLFAAAVVGVIAAAWAIWEGWRPEPPVLEERVVVDDPSVHIPKVGLVARVTVDEAEEAIRIVEALQRGGVTAVALQAPVQVMPQAVGRARAAFARRVLIGVSGVHGAQDVEETVRAGAEFVLMTSVEPEAIRVCQDARVLAIPGAFTATEIGQAWRLRTGLVAVFPVGRVGPGYVRDLLREAPDIALVADGGITPENAAEFIRAGAAAVVASDDWDVGGERDSDAMTRRARAFVETIDRARMRPLRPAAPRRLIEGPDIR